jgi:hypothetical protein
VGSGSACDPGDRKATQRSDRGDPEATSEATPGDPRSGIYEGAMSNEERDVRCLGCGSLLAKVSGDALVIHRGDLQATVAGQLQAELICYRRSCRLTTVVHIVSRGVGPGTTAPPQEGRR